MSNNTPFFRDAESGVPCPRRDNLMCTIVDRDHCNGAPISPRIITKVGYIEARCSCGDSVEVPDKGLGRAVVAAFQTRHQAEAVAAHILGQS